MAWSACLCEQPLISLTHVIFFDLANKLAFRTTRLKYYSRYLEIFISDFFGPSLPERTKFNEVHLAFLKAKNSKRKSVLSRTKKTIIYCLKYMYKRIEPIQKYICTQLQYFCYFYSPFGYSNKAKKIVFNLFLWHIRFHI